MNQYPLWRYLLVLTVMVLGVLYALPNLYGQDPALQISPRRSAPINEAVQKAVIDALSNANVAVKSSERTLNRILVRFGSEEARSAGLPVITAALDAKLYLVALNLAPATPQWLRSLGGKPMYMGLTFAAACIF